MHYHDYKSLPPAARGLFLKKPPVKHLDLRKNFLLMKSFWESRTLFSKRVLAAGGNDWDVFFFRNMLK
jgi:hypothetical protein